MDDIKIALDAINLYQTQYSQVDKIWGYFSVVTLAIAGFVIGSDKATRSLKEPCAIVAAYLIFCIGNHKALVAGQEQLEQFSIIAINLATTAKLDVSALQPITHEWVGYFHLSVIFAVCVGIMTIAWLRQKSHKKE